MTAGDVVAAFPEMELDLPHADDSLWHIIDSGAEVAYVVDGTPLVTWCGVRISDLPTAVTSGSGRGKGVRGHCPRCEHIRRKFAPDSYWAPPS